MGSLLQNGTYQFATTKLIKLALFFLKIHQWNNGTFQIVPPTSVLAPTFSSTILVPLLSWLVS
jgi:hypothetical protein